MKKILVLASFIASLASPALAADYTVIHLQIDVAKPVDMVWNSIGHYCDIKDWLGMTCQMTAGSGDVGSMRHLTGGPNGPVDEIMVSRTPHSYTYTQPATTILYHGELSAEAVDATHSRLFYTLLYDQAPLATPAAQAANRDTRTERFKGALAKMKEIAEAAR